MVVLADLWLVILISAVFVFIASSIIHMALPMLHAGDYRPLPNEDEVLGAIRKAGVGRGSYVFPHCTSMKDVASPEMMAKYKQGPVGFMTLMENAPMAMGKSLTQWFIYCLVIGLFIAYLASLASIPYGADAMRVFRFTATAAFLGHALGNAVDSIWKGVSWATALRFGIDGTIYALASGGAFAWLWPDAA